MLVRGGRKAVERDGDRLCGPWVPFDIWSLVPASGDEGRKQTGDDIWSDRCIILFVEASSGPCRGLVSCRVSGFECQLNARGQPHQIRVQTRLVGAPSVSPRCPPAFLDTVP